MSKRIKFIGIVFVIGLIAVGLVWLVSDNLPEETSGASTGTNVGQQAPDFTGVTLTGETIQMDDLRGKTVVINAFASWCGPCIIETPHLVAASNETGENVVFIGLNVLESKQAVENYRQEFDVNYPLVLNPDGDLTEIYRPVGLPTTWFIDPDGIVRYVHAGVLSQEIIHDALEDVRQGRQPFAFAN